MKINTSKHAGTSLLELLLFLGFFALTAGVLITVLFYSNDQRVRQQTITSVDQQGLQLLQMLSRRIRAAERILDPPLSSSGSITALQMADESQNPTIITMQTGSLIVAEYETLVDLLPEGIEMKDLFFQNTSATSSRQSLYFSFELSKNYPFANLGEYRRSFDALVSLFPDDDPAGAECGCAVPTCNVGIYEWEICQDDSCQTASVTLGVRRMMQYQC